MKLRKRRLPSGNYSWLIDYGLVDGERKRVSFGEDKEAAQRALAQAQSAVATHGELGVKASPNEMAEFLTYKRRLAEAGSSIGEAVEFFMRHGTLVKEPMLLPDMVESFIWAKREINRSKRTIETYQSVLGSLARMYPQTMAHLLTAQDVEAWLAAQEWSGGTQEKNLGHFRSLYSWASEKPRRHVALDPSEGVEGIHADDDGDDDGEIGTLTVEQCQRMLKQALSEPRLMPYVVIGMFGGVRRCELEKLKWDAINLDEGTVVVNAKIAKTRNRRIVDLPQAAVAWIKAAGEGAVGKTEKVAASNLKRKWPKFWRACGLAVWPKNGLRHTYASMHYAMHQDEAKLQAQMGHVSADVLHKNYRALKTKKEAEKFWALTPKR